MSKIMTESDGEQFPPVEGVTYSLSRLWQSWSSLEKDKELPIQIGGRYSQSRRDGGDDSDSRHTHGHGEQNEYFLFDSYARLKLPCPLTDAKNGDLVVIKTSCEFIELGDHRSGRIIRPPKYQVHVRCQKDHATMNLGYDMAKSWADYLAYVRQHFDTKQFLAVTTPTLVSNPGMEPELEPLATEVRSGNGKRRFFLPTSPELHLKQWLCAGFTEIYEIKNVFRNEEETEIHQPEFFMLEWYRAFATLKEIELDLIHLIHFLNESGRFRLQVGAPETTTVAELFFQILNFNLTPTTTSEELTTELLKRGERPVTGSSWNDLFHQLWVGCVQPLMPKAPLIVRDFPPSQAALARHNPQGWADRFEFFVNGMEIANAFHELNDPSEQLYRFKRDQRIRQEYGRTPLEIDENFMAALEYGLPPSAGIALGLDRLFMCLMGATQLTETRAFPLSLHRNH